MTTTKEMAIKAATKTIMDMFESGEFPEQLGWAIIHRHKDDDKPCLHWSVSNFIIMLAHHTADARTYHQWLEAGRYVRKGSRAFNIIAPIMIKKHNEDTDKDEMKLIGFKAIPVFAFESTGKLDTDQPDITAVDYTPEVIPELNQKIIAALKSWGVTVEYRPVEDKPGALGYFRQSYNEGKGLIVLSENSPAVLAHETMHYLHSLEEDLHAIDNSRAEVIAELGAAVILSYAGISGYELQSWEYLKAFIGEDAADSKVLSKLCGVLAMVEKCILRLLNTIEA